MNGFDRTADEALRRARESLALEELIRLETGVTVTKRGPCPVCSAAKKFGVFERDGRRLYKCFSASCAANTVGDDVGFLVLWRNIDRKTAFKEFLKLAGVA